MLVYMLLLDNDEVLLNNGVFGLMNHFIQKK
jgi:hypothetical protein